MLLNGHTDRASLEKWERGIGLKVSNWSVFPNVGNFNSAVLL